MDRPFRVLGLQQVAIGAPDKSALLKLWIELLGLKEVTTFESTSENVNETVAEIGKAPFQVEVDLMEPLDPNRKPRPDARALNHIGLWVDDLRSAVQWLSERGVRFAPGGIRPGASGHDICFVHPKGSDTFPLSGEGVLLELVQAPPEVIRAHEPE